MAAHPHAELMALYAKDAAETDKPWERWEYITPSRPHAEWRSAMSNPKWFLNNKYRRKPERPWYRVALLKTSSDVILTGTADAPFQGSGYSETAMEKHPNFVKWITDRVYYDVE